MFSTNSRLRWTIIMVQVGPVSFDSRIMQLLSPASSSNCTGLPRFIRELAKFGSPDVRAYRMQVPEASAGKYPVTNPRRQIYHGDKFVVSVVCCLIIEHTTRSSRALLSKMNRTTIDTHCLSQQNCAVHTIYSCAKWLLIGSWSSKFTSP